MTNTTDKAMREAFEAWAVKIGRAAVEDGEVCFFASSFKNVAWLAWQAALASSAAAPEQAAEPDRAEAVKLARVLRGMTECSASPDDLWTDDQPDGDGFVVRAAELLDTFATQAQPAPAAEAVAEWKCPTCGNGQRFDHRGCNPFGLASRWLRNNYQDHPNIASLCDAMESALNASTGIPGAKFTGPWESSRVADFNAGWNSCLYTRPSAPLSEPTAEGVTHGTSATIKDSLTDGRRVLPLDIIEALNKATGSNEWQGDESPATLIGPAVAAIQRLALSSPASSAGMDARRVNAARYLWLKANAEVSFVDELWFKSCDGALIQSMYPAKSELDGAIDAALAATPPTDAREGE